MATTNEITQSIITQARLLDPNISLEPGTPERKIVEAVAESIAAAWVDIDVLSGQLYIDELTGSRLDNFVALFGFGRQIGTRATGIVTVSRDNPSNINSVVRKGTQFATTPSGSVPGLIFTATETATLRANETKAYVRVECTTIGTIGNLPAASINAIANSVNIPGITAVVNELPTTGGTDTELDEQFKIRFQNSIFRNMAGTNDQYLALALSHSSVTKANVIGPQSTYIEYIQVPADADTSSHPFSSESPVYTTSLSSVPYSKYTYTNNYYVGKGVGKNAKYLKPNIDFIFNAPARNAGDSLRRGGVPASTIQPNITLLGNDAVVDGETIPFASNIFLLEHKYMSKASRNVPPFPGQNSSGIYNCVDVYINGEQKQLATSEEQFPSATKQFVNDPTKATHRNNYRRVATGDFPALTSRLHTLYHQPVIDLNSSYILINGNTYLEAKATTTSGRHFTTPVYARLVSIYGPAPVGSGLPDLDGTTYWQDSSFTIPAIEADYFLIEDISEHRGTIRARNGIEWLAKAVTQNTGNSSFEVEYNHNLAVRQLQAVMENSKQITTDVLVHASVFRYMKLYITVMYTPGFTSGTVNQQIVDSVNALFGIQYYGATIQMSDILQAIHNTNGVDNVRWTYENPTSTNHKIEIVTKNGNSLTTKIFFDKDFILNDDELPALADTNNYEEIANALVIKEKAQNTWESN